jgi:pimeloyl-ACP methyl ester carboxylesterase
MWRVCVIPSMLLGLLLAGCAPNQILRPDAARCELPPAAAADAASSAEPACASSYALYEAAPTPAAPGAARSALYELSVVEFDDQGLFRSRDQLDHALQTVRQHPDNVDIVMFIHGWHHSAAAGDSNLLSFQKLLHNLAARNESRHIVGVYVGWRGDTLTLPYLEDLTFWDRKNTSIEVGRGAVYELIERLRLEGRRMKNTRLITIGHSFGASVMLSITKNEVYRDLIQDRAEVRADGANPLEPLTILINPAIEALHFLPLYELPEETARIDAGKYARPRAPRIAVFMSESDSATKFFFRLGRVVSTAFESHNPVVRLNRRGEPVSFSEFQMDTQALGHYKPFVTHTLSATTPGSRVSQCEPDFSNWRDHLVDANMAEGWQARFKVSDTTLSHQRNSPAFSPVWVVKVAENIIRNHNDIWDQRFNCFLEELVLTR